MPYAMIWPFDFSFSGFCFVAFMMFCCIVAAAAEAAKDVGNMAKSALENEHVQEAGKGIFAAWLESTFKK